MRKPLALLIRIAREVIHALFGVGACCRFTPCCSVYARKAISAHGIWRGGWLAVRRLGRCNPLGPYGWDPVPPVEHRHSERVAHYG